MKPDKVIFVDENLEKTFKELTDNELKKEFGNLIFATIRWCDNLGYDPEECIKIAMDCQKKFKK